MTTWARKIDEDRERMRIKRKKEAVSRSAIMQGAKFELEACAFFIDAGYIVYRNTANYGADLVIVKNDKCRIVEVKGSNQDTPTMWPQNFPNACDFIIWVLPKRFIVQIVETGEQKIFSKKSSAMKMR